jgi:hypothetical protein
VLEPEALGGVGVLGLLLVGPVLVVLLVLPVLGLFVLGLLVGLFVLFVLEIAKVVLVVLVFVDRIELDGGAAGLDILGDDRGWLCAVGPGAIGALAFGEQRGKRARQRVDLVGGQHGAVDEAGLLFGEEPLQAEEQRELPPPANRRRLVAGVDLGDSRVQRTATW